MKNSGGEPEGNADDVLNLGRWHTKVAGDVREAIAGLEAIHEVLYARPTVNDQRLPEGSVRIHEHLCGAVGRKAHLLRPSVVAVADRLEVVADDLCEVLLSGAHDRQERFDSAVAIPIPEVPPVIKARLSFRSIIDVPSVVGADSPFLRGRI